jgi:hypothetical protein
MVSLIGGSLAVIAELGVYRGDFAEHCYRTFQPERCVLIDLWDWEAYRDVALPQARQRNEIFEQYFGGDPSTALRQAAVMVKERFADLPGVEIVKDDIARAASRYPDACFDFIYLDGNHAYEHVLADLYQWFPKLKPGGLFVCNDFDESPYGAQQNLGVIPAFVTFSKRFRTFPNCPHLRSLWRSLFFECRQVAAYRALHLKHYPLIAQRR